LLVLSGNMFLDALEVSVSIVALPAIAADLRLGLATGQCVIGGFAVGFGTLLIGGRYLTARWGERRAYLAALLLFAVASAAGAGAPTAAALILTRVLKGACVALTAPTGLSIIAGTYPEGPARNRALSIYSGFGAWGFTAGLLLSGALTGLGWRWTFLLPAPVAVTLFLIGVRQIPRGRPGPTPALRARELIRCRPWLRSALGAAALNGSYWGLLVAVTFGLQGGSGWGPPAAGAALLPASLPVAVLAPFSARLIDRFGARRLIALGALLPPLGCLLYWAGGGGPAGPPAGYPLGVLPALALVGAGFGLCFSALHVQAVAGVRAARQRAATSLYQATVQFGGAAVLLLVTAAGPRAPAVITVVAAAGFGVALVGVLGAVPGAPQSE
jgi:predicted MFS family arabinose efflux permease